MPGKLINKFHNLLSKNEQRDMWGKGIFLTLSWGNLKTNEETTPRKSSIKTPTTKFTKIEQYLGTENRGPNWSEKY